MSHLHLPETDSTPLIVFDQEIATLIVQGKMIPEDIVEVMAPLNKWVDNYLGTSEALHVLFRLYYYNTSSSRQFYLFCKKLDQYAKKGCKVSVRWEFEEGDEESRSDAEEFLMGVSFPYEIVPVTQ